MTTIEASDKIGHRLVGAINLHGVALCFCALALFTGKQADGVSFQLELLELIVGATLGHGLQEYFFSLRREGVTR